ncbi:MAG: hypothetical protein JNG88_08540 [Phycisphaerales bacterium]|nr:hypothetical protein [Phycisphaerales bacterium]
MTTGCNEHRETLAALSGGALDAIAPRAIEQFGRHLADCPRCAAALAGVRANDDADSVISLAAKSAPQMFARDADRIWRAVSTANAEAARLRLFRRGLRLGSPLAAVAACALMVTLWHGLQPAPQKAWGFEAASWVEVDGVEVFDDHSGIFVSSGGDDMLPFIWVIDENGDES